MVARGGAPLATRASATSPRTCAPATCSWSTSRRRSPPRWRPARGRRPGRRCTSRRPSRRPARSPRAPGPRRREAGAPVAGAAARWVVELRRDGARFRGARGRRARSRCRAAAARELVAPYLVRGRLWIAALDLPAPLLDVPRRARRADPLRPPAAPAPARRPPDDLRPRARQRRDAERRPAVHAARPARARGARRRRRAARPPHRRQLAGARRAAVRRALRRARRDGGARSTPTHRAGGRVIAVGTTVTRALETAAAPDGTVRAAAGWTDADDHARARRPRGRRPPHRLARAGGQPPAAARGGRRPRRWSSAPTPPPSRSATAGTSSATRTSCCPDGNQRSCREGSSRRPEEVHHAGRLRDDRRGRPRAAGASSPSVLELRAADPAQRAMLAEYTPPLDLPDGAAVLEVGCGTGPVCRRLATLPGVASVTGVDPSPLFVERARELARRRLDFAIGDARALDVPRRRASTRWCSTPRSATCRTASAALAEAHRVLRPERPARGVRRRLRDDHVRARRRRPAAELRGGGARDARARPVADAADRAAARARRASAGVELRGHTYTSAGAGTDYFLALVDRGADALAARGTVGAPLADALKAEGRARMAPAPSSATSTTSA